MLAGSMLAFPRSVHPDTPDAGAPSESLVQQGRDLAKRGDMMAAKDRFETAFRSTGDAEAVFLAAECWEKVGNDEEARAACG